MRDWWKIIGGGLALLAIYVGSSVWAARPVDWNLAIGVSFGLAYGGFILQQIYDRMHAMETRLGQLDGRLESAEGDVRRLSRRLRDLAGEPDPFTFDWPEAPQ